jgi:hypothetical protein
MAKQSIDRNVCQIIQQSKFTEPAVAVGEPGTESPKQ